MKRLLALISALLCLTSCASMLERDHLVAVDHVENPPAQIDAAYRVGTYPALLSALRSYAEEGMDTGVLRFPTTYAGNLTVDLEKARRYLLEEDPLGNYALEDLSYHTAKIIAYYEAALTFTYKVDKTELTAMGKAASQSALITVLEKALSGRENRRVVYLTGYPEGEADFFDSALSQAWQNLEQPGVTPTLQVKLYPETGSRRVVVLELEYPQAESEEAVQTSPAVGEGDAP